MPALNADEVKSFVGRGPEYLLTHTVPGGNPADDLACYRAHHPGIMLPMTQLLPGASNLLAALHRLGKKIGLCSNKPRLFSQKLLQHLEVADYFDVVLGPEDVARPKPAPDMLPAGETLPQESWLTGCESSSQEIEEVWMGSTGVMFA